MRFLLIFRRPKTPAPPPKPPPKRKKKRPKDNKTRARWKMRFADEDGLYRCKVCGLADPVYLLFDVDHIIPKSQGGTDARENLQLLCPTCHRRKTIADGSMFAGG